MSVASEIAVPTSEEVEGSVLADFSGLCLVLVGFDVYDVVLLEVEGRGVEDLLRGEVEDFEGSHAVGFAGHDDFVADAVDGHVAGQGESVEDGDLVPVDFENTGSGDLADDGDLQVCKADVDRGVVDVASVDDFAGDPVGEFGAGESFAVDGSDDGHADASVFIDGVYLERLVSGCCGGGSGERAERRRGVERHGEFGVLAVDDDRQPVEGFYAYLSVLRDLFGGLGCYVLQIPDSFLRSAGGHQQPQKENSGQAMESIHHGKASILHYGAKV